MEKRNKLGVNDDGTSYAVTKQEIIDRLEEVINLSKHYTKHVTSVLFPRERECGLKMEEAARELLEYKTGSKPRVWDETIDRKAFLKEHAFPKSPGRKED